MRDFGVAVSDLSEEKVMLKPHEKLCLSFEETAIYSGIGENKLRDIAKKDKSIDWLIHIGNHIKIKRPLFEKWLDLQVAI